MMQKTFNMYNLSEAADFLGVSSVTVRRWVNNGKMPEPIYSKERKRGGLQGGASSETLRLWSEGQLVALKSKTKGRGADQSGR